MSDDYFENFDSDVIGQIKLPSFVTFNSSPSQLSLGDYVSNNFSIYHDVNQYHQDLSRIDEEDSGIQRSLPSNSSISTPDMVQHLCPNNKRTENVSCEQSIYQNSESWLNVGFATPNSFFYKGTDRPSKAVTVTHLPNHSYAVLYVEKGRVIELTAKTNFILPANSLLKFDIYTLKGTNEEPVYGDSSGNPCNSSSNLCFIQAVEDKMNSVIYIKSEDSFISMLIPFKSNPFIFSVVFPFLNFKCSTASKKIVLLRISVCSGSSILASSKFQLVSCTSPNRDLKRHLEKFNSKSSKCKIPLKREKTKIDNGKPLQCESVNDNQQISSKINENPQYVIMTENYEIWKILNIVHQQLMEHFNSNKK